MGTIETKINQSRDLTIVKATGKITANNLQDWVSTYYTGTVTKLMLWDMIETDLSAITKEDVLEHVRSVKKNAEAKRREGKTAMVVDDNWLAFGLSRMREIYGELEESPVEIGTFKEMEDAMKWLGIKDS